MQRAVLAGFASLVLALALAACTPGSSVRESKKAATEPKVLIHVFIKDGAPAADVDALRTDILSMPSVAGVTYVSKRAALARFTEHTTITPALAAQLRGNPLPASLEVALDDRHQVAAVVRLILKDPHLAEVVKDPSNPTQDMVYPIAGGSRSD